MGEVLHTFENGAALAEGLADAVAKALSDAIAARGIATLVVSGGSTPKAFFQALSTRALDWPKVVVTLVDERFVPPESDRSNHKLVTDNLLRNAASAARFLPLYHAAADAEEIRPAFERGDRFARSPVRRGDPRDGNGRAHRFVFPRRHAPCRGAGRRHPARHHHYGSRRSG